MKLKIALSVAASLCGSYALAQSDPRPEPGSVIATSNSSMLVKMTTSMSTTTSKPGDPIAGEVIDPRELRGARVQGKVERADHDILAFSFDKVIADGKTFPIQSKLVSVTSSKGNEGRDDLDQRIRIEGAGLIAFGIDSALDEGTEVRISAWKK
jgi:hypothetical protein